MDEDALITMGAQTFPELDARDVVQDLSARSGKNASAARGCISLRRRQGAMRVLRAV